MNRYYPLFLDLSGKSALVIGAGAIAEQKIGSLMDCGAKITVVAPETGAAIKTLARKGGVRLRQRRFRASDLKSQDIVFCATDDKALSRAVSAACRQRKIPVNVADQPELCTFIVPAIVRRGEVVFAVSTGGASPALAKFLRKKVESLFGKETAVLAEVLRSFRRKILALPLPKRRKVLGTILNDGTLQAAKKGALPLKRKLEKVFK